MRPLGCAVSGDGFGVDRRVERQQPTPSRRARTDASIRDHGRVMVRGDELRAYVDGMQRVGVRPGRRSRARTSGGWEFLRAP